MTPLIRVALALAFAGAATGIACAGLYQHVLTTSSSLTLKTDDDFLVSAPANPTTGYTWSVNVSNSTVVGFEGAAYQQPVKTMPGAGGQNVFAFEAVHAGVATVTLSYRRVWEKNVRPVKTMVLRVTVTK